MAIEMGSRLLILVIYHHGCQFISVRNKILKSAHLTGNCLKKLTSLLGIKIVHIGKFFQLLIYTVFAINQERGNILVADLHLEVE